MPSFLTALAFWVPVFPLPAQIFVEKRNRFKDPFTPQPFRPWMQLREGAPLDLCPVTAHLGTYFFVADLCVADDGFNGRKIRKFLKGTMHFIVPSVGHSDAAICALYMLLIQLSCIYSWCFNHLIIAFHYLLLFWPTLFPPTRKSFLCCMYSSTFYRTNCPMGA